MQIHNTKTRQLNEPRRKDLAVGNNDNHLWFELFEKFAGLLVFECRRLMDRKLQLQGLAFYRWRLNRVSSASRPIGLGNHS